MHFGMTRFLEENENVDKKKTDQKQKDKNPKLRCNN